MDRRQQERVPLELKVRYRSSDVDPPSERESKNLSAGGIFIRCPKPLDIGTDLSLEIEIDPSSVVRARGRVAWTRRPDPRRRELSPGMGIAFTDLSDPDRETLGRVFAARVAELAAAPPARPSGIPEPAATTAPLPLQQKKAAATPPPEPAATTAPLPVQLNPTPEAPPVETEPMPLPRPLDTKQTILGMQAPTPTPKPETREPETGASSPSPSPAPTSGSATSGSEPRAPSGEPRAASAEPRAASAGAPSAERRATSAKSKYGVPIDEETTERISRLTTPERPPIDREARRGPPMVVVVVLIVAVVGGLIYAIANRAPNDASETPAARARNSATDDPLPPVPARPPAPEPPPAPAPPPSSPQPAATSPLAPGQDPLITAREWIGSGRADDAVVILRQAIANGAPAAAHSLLGQAYEKQNNPQGAIEQYRRFIARKPDVPEAERLRRRILYLGGGPPP